MSWIVFHLLRQNGSPLEYWLSGCQVTFNVFSRCGVFERSWVERFSPSWHYFCLTYLVCICYYYVVGFCGRSGDLPIQRLLRRVFLNTLVDADVNPANCTPCLISHLFLALFYPDPWRHCPGCTACGCRHPVSWHSADELSALPYESIYVVLLRTPAESENDCFKTQADMRFS